jgi:hypothetical protein
MIEHHIQKKILRQLVLGHSRFSELNPSGVDSNLYNYHLHQLIAGHYVEKTDDNRYQLTELGKAEGINLKLNRQERLAQAHSVLLLQVRDASGKYLLRKRTAHPMHGRTGFLHGEPKAAEPLTTTATRVLLERTGLTGEFNVVGSGFIRIFLADKLESFTSFTMLAATIDYVEPPVPGDETGENFWTDSDTPDFSQSYMLPSMADLSALCAEHEAGHFFSDKNYYLE